MGWWTERILPGVLDKQLSQPMITAARARVCAGLRGEVVEIGFGSGLNVPHYPRAVTTVRAIEPSARAWELAARRVAASRVPITLGGLDGQQIDAQSGSADAVLVTFTLCTIPDAASALSEMRRVLQPGGTVHFLEHGRSPDARVAAWQRRLGPVQYRCAGGCHLDREIDRLIRDAGFTIDELTTEYLSGPALSRPFTYTYLGVASVS